jgi:hypothetical protein
MGALDDLTSINGFDKYEKFIKQFILNNTNLWKLVFYPYSNPLEDERAVDPENPYEIFERQSDSEGKIIDSHGVVLFDDKDDTIQNSSNVTVLVNYSSTRASNSYFFDTNFINFQIICKGNTIRKLSNGKDRTEVIANIINNNLALARVDIVDEIHKLSYTKLSLNEQNVGYSVTFKVKGASNDLRNNVNYNRRKYGVDVLP